MRKIGLYFALVCSIMFTGCIKNAPVIFENSQIEFDAASWNANSAGVSYPILTRVPLTGTVTPTSQPSITRTTGNIALRVNLVGAQRNVDTEFTYEVVSAESTAISGTHYTALSGKGTIPAKSSFGTITIEILNPGASTGSRDLVLRLTDNATVTASVNYAKTGIRISQN